MRVSFIAMAIGLAAQAIPGLSVLNKPQGNKKHTHSSPDQISNGTFDQLLDHKDPSKGTFKQRYWWDATHWKGPGSPVFVFNSGEEDASNYTGYLENITLPGLYAQQFGGAVILIEHRYWGESIPFELLTTETLQYLDVPQSVFDMTYFAANVSLEFDDSNGGANAPNSPWVLIGGSYSGALAAWTSVLAPDVFYAYHASSAVVEAIYDFYYYYEAVERGIPQNCSADVKAVVSYIDAVFDSGDEKNITDLKALFGLQSLDHADDFAEYVAQPLINWQTNETIVLDFCDYIETSTGSPSDEGVGLEAALRAYGAYINETEGVYCAESICSSYSVLNFYDNPLDKTNMRQWNWLLCHNPFAWWQVGPPQDNGTYAVSSQLRPDHFQRQCPLMFPTEGSYSVGSVEGFTTEHLNMYTGGWDADFERVLFVNGGFDPWLPATVGSPHRPGGPRTPTDLMPILTVEDGNHVPDMILHTTADQDAVTQQELDIMGNWLNEWKAPS